MQELKYNSKPDTYFASVREEMLGFIPKTTKTMLDVGCGDGSFGYVAKKITGADIWGIELNEKMESKASSKLDSVLIGDFFDKFESIPKNYFDCITFNDVLEHFLFPADALALTKNLLSVDGVVVCSIPNVRYIKNLWELLIKKDWQYKIEGILDYTHFRFFTKKSIIDLFNSNGFEVIKIQGINPTKKIKLLKILNILFLGFLSDTYFLQFAVVAKARK